jgi:hypothetical protein
MYDNSFEGRVYLNATATAGTTGTSEETLMTFSLPANSLYKPGQGLRITAGFLNSSSDTVSYKLYFGAESSTASVTTTTGGTASIDVFNLGSAIGYYTSSDGQTGAYTAASNSQLVVTKNTSGSSPSASTFTQATENTSAAIIIKLTATATSSGANATAEYLSVEFLQNA